MHIKAQETIINTNAVDWDIFADRYFTFFLLILLPLKACSFCDFCMSSARLVILFLYSYFILCAFEAWLYIAFDNASTSTLAAIDPILTFKTQHFNWTRLCKCFFVADTVGSIMPFKWKDGWVQIMTFSLVKYAWHIFGFVQVDF